MNGIFCNGRPALNSRTAPGRLLPAALGAALLLFQAGCRTSSPGHGTSHAAVIIPDHTDAEVRQVARQVFAEDGYSVHHTGADLLEFRRAGSSMDRMKFGDWMDDGVSIRAKLKISTLADGAHLLQLDMYSFKESKDVFFQEETRMVLLNRRHYQKLLDEIVRRLVSAPFTQTKP